MELFLSTKKNLQFRQLHGKETNQVKIFNKEEDRNCNPKIVDQKRLVLKNEGGKRESEKKSDVNDHKREEEE